MTVATASTAAKVSASALSRPAWVRRSHPSASAAEHAYTIASQRAVSPESSDASGRPSASSRYSEAFTATGSSTSRAASAPRFTVASACVPVAPPSRSYTRPATALPAVTWAALVSALDRGSRRKSKSPVASASGATTAASRHVPSSTANVG